MAGPTPCAFGQHKKSILSFPDNYGFFYLFGELCEKDQPPNLEGVKDHSYSFKF